MKGLMGRVKTTKRNDDELTVKLSWDYPLLDTMNLCCWRKWKKKTSLVLKTLLSFSKRICPCSPVMLTSHVKDLFGTSNKGLMYISVGLRAPVRPLPSKMN